MGPPERRPGPVDCQAAERRSEMSRLCQFALAFLKNEDGPTAVEYAVMLALIVVVCIAAITAIGTNANSTFSSVGSTLGATAS